MSSIESKSNVTHVRFGPGGEVEVSDTPIEKPRWLRVALHTLQDVHHDFGVAIDELPKEKFILIQRMKHLRGILGVELRALEGER